MALYAKYSGSYPAAAVNARYYASSTTISGTLATIAWTTKDYDSYNAMTAGTYTVPITSKYQVNCSVLIAGTVSLNDTIILEIQKNGTVVSRSTVYLNDSMTAGKAQISDIISCSSGDTLRIRVSTMAASPTIVSSNFDNFISLCAVGT